GSCCTLPYDRSVTFLFSLRLSACSSRFFFNDTATTGIYTLSLHDALPIFGGLDRDRRLRRGQPAGAHRRRGGHRALQRLGLRAGHRADPDVRQRRQGHARHGRGRRPLHLGLRDGGLMRVPLSWLRSHVDLPEGTTARGLAGRLTEAGLEVETVESVGADITGPLVAGRVLEIEELTGFKKPIRYCKVDVGAANGT